MASVFGGPTNPISSKFAFGMPLLKIRLAMPPRWEGTSRRRADPRYACQIVWIEMTPDGGRKSCCLIAPAKTQRQEIRPGAVWEIHWKLIWCPLGNSRPLP